MAFDTAWPEEDLEAVSECPCCGCSERSLAYSEVQDWAFHTAPGRWQYWSCGGCRALSATISFFPSGENRPRTAAPCSVGNRPAQLI